MELARLPWPPETLKMILKTIQIEFGFWLNQFCSYTTKNNPSDHLVANGAKWSKTNAGTPRKHARPNGQSFGREQIVRPSPRLANVWKLRIHSSVAYPPGQITYWFQSIKRTSEYEKILSESDPSFCPFPRMMIVIVARSYNYNYCRRGLWLDVLSPAVLNIIIARVSEQCNFLFYGKLLLANPCLNTLAGIFYLVARRPMLRSFSNTYIYIYTKGLYTCMWT